MLSTSAERVYWLGRYIERTEDTARMLKAFSQVMMDIPKAQKLDWNMLLRILSSEHEFNKLYDEATEKNVIKFLLADIRNPSSIRSSIKAARENARTSRDVIPTAAWEMLNDLNLFIKESVDDSTHKRVRYKFLTEIISRSLQFNGMIQNSLSRNQAYDFLQLGIMLERADMTSRILDVAAGILLRRDSIEINSFDMLIWLEILKAQNAVQMYRSANGPKIEPTKVLHFILCREEFPRSIKYCLSEIERSASKLPDNQDVFEGWDLLLGQLNSFDENKEVSPEFLHRYFDDIQKGIIKIHNRISLTWFPKSIEVITEQTSDEEIDESPLQNDEDLSQKQTQA
ncbi:alpha-E domain-containing protein [Cocleimonas flava]|uniref:Putative alpha-E superfamily protein n=1 Tax=Cocleimonas flava TaxID=634765 RepID=A0A4R1END0_9GAMM|nr:alpha-E domain-containing protein [Cocleimonas flava]TCJ82746.1 putative alpha-E superfamily protein [Cocleimonas flava]